MTILIAVTCLVILAVFWRHVLILAGIGLVLFVGYGAVILGAAWLPNLNIDLLGTALYAAGMFVAWHALVAHFDARRAKAAAATLEPSE